MKKPRAQYWASKKSKIIHDAKAKSQACGVEWVNPVNLTRFITLEFPEMAGYRKCRRCFREVKTDAEVGADAGN